MPGSPPPPFSIALWRGYVKAKFYLRDPQSGEAHAESPAFRTWRFPWQGRKALQEDPAAVAALAALRSDLLSRGWERVPRAPSSEWFEFRYRRSRFVDRGALTSPTPAHARSQNGSGLEDALELTLLVARTDPRRHPRVAARWLLRYLEEDPEATIEEAALAASCLAALPGAGYPEAAQTLKAMAESATRRRRESGVA